MALPAATVWEIRPGAGSDNNGGGFVAGASGTDRSQQNSAQVTYTDLVIDATTNTKLTSAGFPFTAAEVGNIIQITSGTGFTTGFYQVVSVAAGVATMDRAVGTTSSTGGHGALGGALATVSAAWTAGVTSNTYYLTGTLTVTSALSMGRAVTSSDAGPNAIIGYGSVRGDGTRAKWTTSTNSAEIVNFAAANGILFQNIEFESTAGTPGYGLRANLTGDNGGIVLDNCLVHGFLIGIRGDWQAEYAYGMLILYRSRVYSCTSHGVLNFGGTQILASYIHDNAGDGFQVGNNNGAPKAWSLVWRSVIKSNGGKGINDLTQASLVSNPRFVTVLESDVLNNTGDGITVAGNPGGTVLLNSIMDGNGGVGLKFNNGFFAFQVLGSVAWRSNTGGDVTNATKSPSDVTLTGDPFTARGSDDFTLNSTAGAGQACRAIGQPAVFPP